jgi:uncharacterized protein (TIGR00251 family)
MSQTHILKVMVQPKASCDEIVGMHGEYLKIRLKALPTEGQANAALIKLLAKHYGVTQSQVKIIGGKQSRYKTVAINQS